MRDRGQLGADGSCDESQLTNNDCFCARAMGASSGLACHTAYIIHPTTATSRYPAYSGWLGVGRAFWHKREQALSVRIMNYGSTRVHLFVGLPAPNILDILLVGLPAPNILDILVHCGRFVMNDS